MLNRIKTDPVVKTVKLVWWIPQKRTKDIKDIRNLYERKMEVNIGMRSKKNYLLAWKSGIRLRGNQWYKWLWFYIASLWICGKR